MDFLRALCGPHFVGLIGGAAMMIGAWTFTGTTIFMISAMIFVVCLLDFIAAVVRVSGEIKQIIRRGGR